MKLKPTKLLISPIARALTVLKSDEVTVVLFSRFVICFGETAM